MYISEDDVIALHESLVVFFANDGDPISPSGVRDYNLLSSATHRPQTSLGDKFKYNTMDEKAAALLHSLIKNHPFHNGNKRTALISTLIFYDRDGSTLEAGEEDLYSFITDIAKGNLDGLDEHTQPDIFFRAIVKCLRAHKRTHVKETGDLTVKDFLENCERAGARVTREKKGGSVGVLFNGKSIRISKSRKRIGPQTAKKFLSDLGISQAYTGIKLDEFLTGSFTSNNVFKSILPVLRKLAVT